MVPVRDAEIERAEAQTSLRGTGATGLGVGLGVGLGAGLGVGLGVGLGAGLGVGIGRAVGADRSCIAPLGIELCLMPTRSRTLKQYSRLPGTTS